MGRYGDCSQHLHYVFHAGNGDGVGRNDNFIAPWKGEYVGGKRIEKSRVIAVEKAGLSLKFFQRFFIYEFYLQEDSFVNPNQREGDAVIK